MSSLATGAALAIALTCAPRAEPGRLAVSPDVLISVADTESGLDPLAIHDNATGATLHPANRAEAIATASRLIAADHRPDLGLMQINSPANLVRTGLTVETVFDPCASIRAGAQILLDHYAGGNTTGEQQAAILRALSAYNTGSATAGLRTYAPAVLASARKIIPALQIAGFPPYATPMLYSQAPTVICDHGSKGWDIGRTAPCREAGTGANGAALPDGDVQGTAPVQVFIHPAAGSRELVFSAN